MSPLNITQPLDSIRYMVFFLATIFGDVQYTQVMESWDIIYQPLNIYGK